MQGRPSGWQQGVGPVGLAGKKSRGPLTCPTPLLDLGQVPTRLRAFVLQCVYVRGCPFCFPSNDPLPSCRRASTSAAAKAGRHQPPPAQASLWAALSSDWASQSRRSARLAQRTGARNNEYSVP